jgi:hypothetical protein
MDVAPLMAMQTQEVFLALSECRSFGKEKCHENTDEGDTEHTDKKQSVYDILPI